MPLHLVPLVVGPLILFPLAAYALVRRRDRVAAWYAVLLLAIGWWGTAYAWELVEAEPAVKILALKIKYLGVVAMPVAWVGFVLAFVDIEPRVNRIVARGMVVVAVTTLILAWTNELHGWFWGPISIEPAGAVSVLRGVGVGFWLNIAYTYAALSGGLVLLIAQAIRSPYLYGARGAIVVAAAVLPWLGNVVFVVRREQAALIDPTPLLFACSALLGAVAVFRYGLLDPIPSLRRLPLELMGDAIVILDSRRLVADLNPAAESVLGLPRAQALGAPVGKLLAGWQGGMAVRSHQDLVISGPQGESVFEMRSTTVRATGGRVTGTVVVLRDVTLRRHAEQALRDSERRYRDLVEHASDLIFALDLTGRATAVNRACLEITGYSREEIVGRDVLDFVVPEDRERAVRLLRLSAQSDRARTELTVAARDGRRVTLEVSGWLQFRGGRAVGIQAIARDVTASRQLEAELRQAQKMEAIGQLAGGVAHDFNNLMTTIIGFTTLAREHVADDSPARGWLHQILHAAEQAAAVTRQLLAFGRRQILQPVVLDLNGIVSSTEQVLRRLIGAHLSLETQLAPDLAAVRADPVQVQQVIINLVVNARDAMPGGGTIAIRTRNERLEGDPEASPGSATPCVVLEVADTGVGIEEAVMGRIFEPFFTTKALGKGSGLGLSTVHGIVKQSGGEIRVTSQPGVGTTFTIFLPAVEEPHRSERAEPV